MKKLFKLIVLVIAIIAVLSFIRDYDLSDAGLTGSAPSAVSDVVELLVSDDTADTPDEYITADFTAGSPEAGVPDSSSTPDEYITADFTTGSSETAAPDTADLTETAEDSSVTSGDIAAEAVTIAEDGVYTSKEDVALYIHTYGKLPSNFISKKEAEAAGWSGGSLEPYCPGKCIGGSYFGNYEGLLPTAKGRKYTECDINTLGAKSRGAERIVFSNDGLIYYTPDHYESFELLYGEP